MRDEMTSRQCEPGCQMGDGLHDVCSRPLNLEEREALVGHRLPHLRGETGLRGPIQALRALLRSLVRLAMHRLHAALVHRWPELRQSGRSVKLGEIGAMMQAQRELRDTPQRTSAEECGVTTSLYGRLERGEDVNTVGVLRKVCAWLGIDPREIDYEMDTPTRRSVGVVVTDCDSGGAVPGAVSGGGADVGPTNGVREHEPDGSARDPHASGADQGADAAEQ